MRMNRVGSAVLLVATAVAPQAWADEREQHTVGGWRIIANFETSGKLNRCIAEQKNPSGMMRLHLFPNNRWALSVPGSVPGLKQTPKTKVWAELTIVSKDGTRMEGMLADVDGSAARAGFNENFTLIPQIRRGQSLSVKMFNKQEPGGPSKLYSWPLRDVAGALDETVTCMRDNK